MLQPQNPNACERAYAITQAAACDLADQIRFYLRERLAPDGPEAISWLHVADVADICQRLEDVRKLAKG